MKGWFRPTPKASASEKVYNGGMTQGLLPFFGHLEEFRRRLIVCLAAIGAGAAFSFFYIDEMMALLLQPVRPLVGQIYFFSPTDAFVTKVKVALLAGLLIASPLIVCQFWLFVSPAMHEREKRALLPVVFITSFLFLTGALFSFFQVIPVALDFLIGQQTFYLRPLVSIQEYLGFISGMMIAFGVSFNLPVFIMALVLSGLVTFKTLQLYQRHIIVLIFIAAAVLTPGPDIASQLMLGAPLIFLFQISLLAAWLVERSQKKKKTL